MPPATQTDVKQTYDLFYAKRFRLLSAPVEQGDNAQKVPSFFESHHTFSSLET